MRFPVTVTRSVIVGAFAWTLSTAFFVAQAIAQAASARPFSLATNLISDLGNTSCGHATCSPLHTLVNATFIVVGLLHAGGAVATWHGWPAGARSSIGLVLLTVAGCGLAWAGLFPENVSLALHSIGAVLGLVCLNASMVVLGWVLLEPARRAGVLAVVAGLVGLVGLAAFAVHAPGLPIGVWERIADYPAAAMVVVIGGLILVRARRVQSG